MIKDFTYLKPTTLKEAFTMLNEHQDECKVICGGQSLLILMRQGLVITDYLIDIKNLNELKCIQFDQKEGLKIGAATTHREIEKSAVIREHFSVLSDMETKLASIQTRNWGTIGGNLAHADPAGDPGPVLIALKSNLKVGSVIGERTIALEDFFVDYFETALNPNELVLEVQVPVPEPRTATTYAKFNLLDSDMGIVTSAASMTLDNSGTCKDARVVLGNAGPTPRRVKRAEEFLIGMKLEDGLFEQAGRIASEDSEPVADIHASEEYRRHLLMVMTKRMLKKAWEQAKSLS